MTSNEHYMMKLANARLLEIYELRAQIAAMAKGEQDVLDQITVVKTESGEVVAVTSYQKMIEELRAENEALKEEVRKYEKHIAIRYLEENK